MEMTMLAPIQSMNKRRALYGSLSILALFLLGTVLVLSSVSYYLAVDPEAYISEAEVPILDNTTRWNAATHGKVQRIPRIIHQTWKTETLPARWSDISQACRDMMPDYEYMLWTDASSREFIAEHYSWFLDTFDNYTYPIQRADAIRYFVLFHFGGVYIDLDIGCIRPLDPLLIYPVILPKTIPVGVSNDLMFAEQHHPLLEQTIHNLINFDHSWVLNYPTVMFSTGPMFLSAQYGIYTAAHRNTAFQDIRILPKALYGKNARDDEAPHSFFSHFYGSSWHADDAAFIGFLGSWGKVLMWIGLAVLIIGLIYIPSKQRRNFRRIGAYEILLPRLSPSGRFHFHHWTPSFSFSGSTLAQLPSSPTDSETGTEDDVPVLHLPFDDQSTTTSDSLGYSNPYAGRTQSPIIETFQRVINRVRTSAGSRVIEPDTPIRTGRRTYNRGVLFFLPAIFTQSHNMELQIPAPRISPFHPLLPRYPPHPPEKVQDLDSSPHFFPGLDSETDTLPLVVLEDAPRSRTPRPREL